MLDDRQYKERYRKDIIKLGTEERLKDPEVWCKKLDDCITDHSQIIITDIRYPNEIEYFLRKYPARVVRIHCEDDVRRERGWEYNADIDESETETLLDTYNFDYIINNSSTDGLCDNYDRLLFS
ncbi:uncharacterized protein METZ01_LOCUS458077 [marine metagenome]|uniref:Phosphomevalonate kinase n=1 Tax=marine metagenome TaxID=408172 RepID=A0A383AC95_9ZZZZ